MTDTSSMGEIPDDVMEAARECLAGAKFFPPSDMEPTVVTVAQAILAERARCVKVANNYAKSYEAGLCHYGAVDKDGGRGRQEGHIHAGQDIADVIRKGVSP